MVTPMSRMLNVFGSEGWVKVRAPDTLEVSLGDSAPETRHIEEVNPVRANMEGFADAIAGQGTYKFTTDEMIHDVAVLAAIERSLASGKRESVL